MIRLKGFVHSFRESRFPDFLRRWRCRALCWHATETDIHTPAAVETSDGVLRGIFSGKACQRNLFARECPASLEGPPEAWEFVRIVIDHGCCIFEKLDSYRQELGLRDLVVQALFRRILITGEAVRSLLSRGLEEPAFATSRTFQELERDFRLVIADSSDTRARRLAAFLPVKGRRNFDKAPKNPDTLKFIQGNTAFFGWFRERSRSFREWLESEAFRDVAEELKQGPTLGHGFANQEEAFKEAGMANAYYLEYGGSSLFVHGNHVEHDFADANDTVIRLKAFAQRDPEETLPQLGRLTLALVDLYRLIWEDRDKPEYQEPVRFEDENCQTCEMDVLVALTARAISIFPNPVPPDST